MKSLFCVLPFVLAIVGAMPAQAQSKATVMQACRSDAVSLCRSVRPGGGRVAACLEANKAQLSPACAAELPQVQQCTQELRTLCDSDGKADAELLRRCVRNRAAEFSPACRVAS